MGRKGRDGEEGSLLDVVRGRSQETSAEAEDK